MGQSNAYAEKHFDPRLGAVFISILPRILELMCESGIADTADE